MATYLCFLILLIIIRLSTPHKKYLLCFFVIGYTLLAMLRGASVGTDTKGYILDYIKAGTMSWDKLFKSYSPNYGYFIFSKFFYTIGINYHIWFGIVALLYILSVYFLITRYSQDAFISICLFFALGFFAFSLAGLKQVMAMSFLNFALFYLKDKHHIKAIIFAIIACFFHVTDVIFYIETPP